VTLLTATMRPPAADGDLHAFLICVGDLRFRQAVLVARGQGSICVVFPGFAPGARVELATYGLQHSP
jgi:hypothetical protein